VTGNTYRTRTAINQSLTARNRSRTVRYRLVRTQTAEVEEWMGGGTVSEMTVWAWVVFFLLLVLSFFYL